MPIVVEALPPQEFEQWVAQVQAEKVAQAQASERSWTLDELMTQGEKAYLSTCAACHQASGEGIPPAFPALKNSPVALGDISAHIDIVLNGKPGTAMQAFRDQLSAADLAAVITYERNAWGNSTGDAVSPAQITQLLEGNAESEGEGAQ